MAPVFRFRRASRGKPRWSIRARLVVLALLTVVPLMLDRVRLLEASRSERIEMAASEALDYAHRGADAQRDVITTARAMLQMMARVYVTTRARGETCNVYLSELTTNMPWIKGISIVGPDARIKCSTFASGIGLDVSDRDYYRRALETRDFVVSNYLVGRLRRAPALITVYPTIAIDDSVNAVIIASVDLQWLNGLIGALDRRAGSMVVLVDNSGVVLAGDADTAGPSGRYAESSALMKEISSRPEGTLRTEGPDGVRRIFSFVSAPASDAHLVVGFDEAEVLRRVDREILIAYVQLGIFGMLVLIIAWFGGERMIVQPIRSLARTATRIGRGDLDVRPATQGWAPEFEPLAVALNETAQKLAERDRELRAANRHLEELASLDSLSGLANRRGFDARLTADWQRAGRLGRPVALLMVDVDHFKLFNDRYGHVEGDVCLRRLAKLLMAAADDHDDLPARYGGEEFALLLPGADLERAHAVAEQLRRAVEDLCIAHGSSPCGQVTISVGVASLIPGLGQDAERLIEAADAGLYAAKHSGRNAVVAHARFALLAAS